MNKLFCCVAAIFVLSSIVHAESLYLMPLGDSITYGTGDDDSFGYRNHLQDELAHVFNFVGSETDPDSHASYDVDHAGFPGQRTDQLETWINSNISTYFSGVDGPNSCILLHAGTNDIIQQEDGDGTTDEELDSFVANVEDIIDIIDAYNSDIKVYVASIIPSTDSGYEEEFVKYRTKLATMISGYDKDNLYLVDMKTPFTPTTGLMSDANHPNNAGYLVMAETWASAINENYSAKIEASKTSGASPLLVNFYDSSVALSNTTNQFFHNREYRWIFGDSDAGSWYFNGKSKNVSYGAIASHVFETPGQYTVILTVRDASGTVSTDTITITVTSQDDSFPTTATTCLNKDGDSDFTGCPSGANQENNDDLSSSAVEGYLQDGERLLLKRGSSWTISSTPAWPASNGPVVIGAYGTCSGQDELGICSNDPEVNLGGNTFFDLGSNQEVLIEHISFDGGSVSTGLMDFQNIAFFRLSVDNVTGAGIGWGHYNDATPMTIDNMSIVECRIEDTSQWGLYVGSERMAILGNEIMRTGSHNVRVWQAYRGTIQNNLIYSTDPTGSGNGHLLLKLHGPDDVSEDPEHCTPTNGTACLENYTEFVVVSDNIFGKSGGYGISLAPQSTIADTQITDIVFERNKFILDYGDISESIADLAIGLIVVGDYISLRNNIMDLTGASEDLDFILVDHYVSDTTGCMIYNNTLYRSDVANDLNDGVVVASGAENTIVRNNLISLPNVSSGNTTEVNDSGTGTTQSNNNDIDNPSFTDPNNVTPLSRNFSLQLGSSAIDQGYTVLVLDDYINNRRTGLVYDIGAFEYVSRSSSSGITFSGVTIGQ
jgi:lysophospholipase L1-like esterase